MRRLVVRQTLPGPAFLIRTKHHSPPTWVGSGFESRGSSSVFAFASRALARRVAQGLEAHRRAAGHFPSVVEGNALQLGPDEELREPDLLEIQELDAAGLAALVEGSGVAVCYMREDATEDRIRASVVRGTTIRRAWIHDMYSRG